MRHRARDGFDDREDMVNVTMKNEGGLCMGIVGTQSVKRGMVTIGPNVHDLDGPWSSSRTMGPWLAQGIA